MLNPLFLAGLLAFMLFVWISPASMAKASAQHAPVPATSNQIQHMQPARLSGARTSSLHSEAHTSKLSQQTARSFAPWGWIATPNDRQWLTGEFNGDGLTDIAYLWKNPSINGATTVYLALANGDGTYSGTGSTLSFADGNHWAWFSNPSQAYWFVGDFNGDGKDDLAYTWNDNGRVTVYTAFSRGDGTFNSAGTQPMFGDTRWYWFGQVDSSWEVGDFNGDGKADLAYLVNDNAKVMLNTLFSRGDGTFTATSNEPAPGGVHWGWKIASADRKFLAGDFNGDGKTDIAYLWNQAGIVVVYLAISNGNGEYIPTAYVPANPQWGWNSRNLWLGGDFNGDNRLDLAYLWRSDQGGVVIYSAFSNGDGGFTAHAFDARIGGGWLWDTVQANSSWQVVDNNGDGKSDIIYLHNDNGSAWAGVGISNGDGNFSMTNGDLYDSGGSHVGWAASANNQVWLAGDANGDFRTDILQIWNNGNGNQPVVYALLSTVDRTFYNVGTALGFTS